MADQKSGWIEKRISTGNLIVLATIVGSLALGWGRLESGLAHHDDRILDLEEGAKSLMAERMREARDVADMRADMRWIRATLERLEQDLKSKN